MKKIICLIYCLICHVMLAAQEENNPCVYPCPKDKQANIFGTNFCCEIKKNGKDIDCNEWIGELQKGKCKYQKYENVSILIYEDSAYSPSLLQTAKNELPDLKKELATNPTHATPQVTAILCPNKKISIAGGYAEGRTYIFEVFKQDSFIIGDFDIGAELEQDLFNYFCNLFDPKTFLTPQGKKLPIYQRPISNTVQEEVEFETVEVIEETPIASHTKKDIQRTNLPTEKIETTKEALSSKRISATPQPLTASNAWHILGDYFYPAMVPGNLSSMRRFETKNKTKEIKINFSSKDKKPFLEKLKTAHRYHPARQTDCADGSILYETVENGLYQAFLLRPNAMAVFTSSYNLPTLPEEPHASKLQKDLCALDINSKW